MEDTEIHLKGYAEEFNDFLENKITQINSQLNVGMVVGLVMAHGADSCPVI